MSRRSRNLRGAASGSLFSSLLLLSTSAAAVQVVVADGAAAHSDAAGATATLGAAGLPMDLTSPDALATGTLHHRVTVTAIPAAANTTTYKVCFVQGANRACSDNSISFDAAGTFTTTQDMSALDDYATVDWTMPIDDVEVVAMDTAGVPIDPADATWIGAPDTTLYYPLNLTYQAVIVADGDAFEGFPGEMLTPAPTIRPGTGTYEASVDVTLDPAEAGHSIRYTLNGNDPTATSTLYAGTPITITQSTTLKAVAFADGLEPSSVAEATYTIVDMLPNGLRGRYYNGRNFGSLAMTRTDAQIDFEWDGTTPSPDIDNPFSVIWTGSVVPRYSDNYTFKTINDDGTRLWVNNQLVIDDWNDHGPQERTGNINLQQGVAVSIWLEYYNGGGPGTIQLSWLSDQQGEEVIGGTSLDPDPVGNQQAQVSLLANFDEEVRENSGEELSFDVRRRGDIEAALTVNLAVEGTATEGQDFTPITKTVQFGAGELSKTITFTLTDDSDAEGEEVIEFSIASGSGYSISNPSSASLTILDNDVDEFSISGSVIYTGTESGDIVVEAFRDTDSVIQKRRAILKNPGEFQIGEAEPGTYTVIAYVDTNANQRFDDGEVWGEYLDASGLPLQVTIPPAATGVVINIDTSPGGGGEGDGDGGDGGCCATTRPGHDRTALVFLFVGVVFLVRRRRRTVR